MTTNLSPRERQKIARREAILQAARQVFLSGNLHTATIATVAEAAHVSKGTVYLYFESKEALLAELLREGLQLLEAQLTAAYAADEPLPPDVRVARVAGAYLDFAQAQPDVVRLRVAFDNGHIDADLPSELAGEIRQLRVRGVELIAEAIRDGTRQKLFRRTQSYRVAAALWAALDGALLMAGDEKRPRRGDTRADALFQATLETFLRDLGVEG